MGVRNPPAERLFNAVITPNRSLPPVGFALLMAGLSGASFAAGAALALLGAWPVFGFFGLDVLLVYLAFRASYRSGRAREELSLSRDELVIRRFAPSGRLVSEVRLNPYWVRLEAERDDEGRIALASHGVRHSIAEELSPSERASFARALSKALAAVRAV